MKYERLYWGNQQGVFYLLESGKKGAKAKREQVTQDVSYSIVASALADIPLDTVAPATMHVILGLAKHIYEWMLQLYRKLEELEKKKKARNTTYQFCQGIVETRDSAIEYGTYLETKFKGVIDSSEGQRLKSIKLMKEIEKATARGATAKLGHRQDS